MRPLFGVLLLLSCTRPVTEQPQPRGVELEQVKLTTWKGSALTARGTAGRATLSQDGFVAEAVELYTAQGTAISAPRVQGDLDLDPLTADGLQVKTAEGCVGSTAGRVSYSAAVAITDKPVDATGCGFSANGSKLTYYVLERRAEVEGPVRTRLEAAK